MCAVSTISLSLSEPSFRGPFCCRAYQRGRPVSCALLARGSFEIESGFCVHLSRSFRESALSWAGECSLALLLFFFSAELRPPVAPDCHVKSCLAARVLHSSRACS